MTPKYTPRCLMENKSLMQMFTSTIIPPPPMPWIARAAISIAMSTASPQSSEPTQNTPTADSSTGLRPQMSEILPQVGTKAALASRYAEPIQM